MMASTPKTKATNNAGLQDDHDPNDLGQKLANKPKPEKSQLEGPAAYAPHQEAKLSSPILGVIPQKRRRED